MKTYRKELSGITTNNLEDGDNAKKSYTDYVAEKKEKVERFSLKAVEELGKVQFDFPNPKDHNEYVEKSARLNHIGTMAMDLFQSIKPLKGNKIAPTDAKMNKLTERSQTVYDYVSTKLYPLIQINNCVRKYSGFLASKVFVETNEFFPFNHVNVAAQAKASLNKIYEKTRDVKTFGDIMNNEKLNCDLSAIGFTVNNMLYVNDEREAKAHLSAFLRAKKPVDTAYINEQNKCALNFGKPYFYTIDEGTIISGYNDSINKMKTFVDTEKTIREGGSVSQAFEDKIRTDKENVREVISFDKLLGDKPKETAKTVKSAEMKAPEIKTPDKK